MKRKIKSLLSLLLILGLLVSVLTACGNSDSPEQTTEHTSEGLSYTLSQDGNYSLVSGIGTCKDTELTISASYNGKSVKAISSGAFFRCFSLTDISIPDSVTCIGQEAFSDCVSLKTITIPESVITIGDRVFSHCDALKAVTFQGSTAKWQAIKKANDWNENAAIESVVCTDGVIAIKK